MKVSYPLVQDIVKTLPVGYYLGRELKVIVDENASTSYCDIMNDELHVSYSSIEDSVKEFEMTPEEIEGVVRTIFYHEVSHAMLTPKNMESGFAINVVEDERIESLMKGYYYGVDFEEQKKKFLKFEDVDECVENAFIKMVRLKDGPQEFIDELNKILWCNKNLTRNSDDWCSEKYRDQVIELYNAFKEWYNSSKQSQNQQGQGQGQSKSDTSSDSQGYGDSTESNSTKDTENNTNASKSPQECLNEREPWYMPDTNNTDDFAEKGSFMNNNLGDKSRSSEKVKSILSSMLNTYSNQNLTAELERIFSSASKLKKANSSGINSYSGVFDPRSAGRDDYKFFVQRNRGGSAKAYSKVHLNLFLDRSGSFDRNVQKANEILYALCQIERRYTDFDFTLITCGVGEDIMDRKDREHYADDGTQISARIFETFKKVQKKDAINYNVVLYDGQAYNGSPTRNYREDGDAGNFAAFNTTNTLIITDDSNEPAMKWCPNARVVISENYTKDLESNLIKMLEILTK